jgi:hypothetical protein
MALPLPYVVDDEAAQGNFDSIKKLFPLSRKHMKLEEPNVVGATGQPAFQNSWVNFDTTTFHGLRFWRDPVGVVHLEGLIKSGVVPSVVFTLPNGYLPINGHTFTVISNGAIGRVDVAPTGNVVVQAGNNTYVALSGITFRQES